MKKFLLVGAMILAFACPSVFDTSPVMAAGAPSSLSIDAIPALSVDRLVADPAHANLFFESVLNPVASMASLFLLFGVVANAPIKRSGRKEINTGDMKIQQKPDVVMPPLGETVERREHVQPVDTALSKDYLEELKFNEEPVTILIPRSSEKDVARCTDLVSVNGVKAEILFRNGWVQIGYLPKGIAFTTKRKNVEALARSKQDNVETSVIERTGEDPTNLVQRFTVAKTPFQVIKDENQKGTEWLQRLVSSQF